MRLLASLLVLGFASITFTAHAAGACPNGVIHVSSWNTFFDGTVSDINGCVVKHDDNEKISTTPQAGTPIPDTPAGWTPPTGSQIQPTPPSPITAPQKSFVSPNYFDPTDCTGAGNQWLVSNNYSAWQLRAGTCVVNAGGNPSPRWTSTIEQIANPSGSTQNITFGSALAPNCGTGYTVSGSNCTATNSSGVPKPSDGKCTVIRTANSFSADPQDPDCTSAFYASTGVTVTATKVSTPTKSATINSDGTVTFNQTITNSNSTTTVSIANFSSGGQLTGTSVQTYSGTGALTSSTPIPSTVSASPSIDVSALNKETTQAAIKAGQCGGTGEPACKIDEADTDAQKTAAVTAANTQLSALDSLFDQLTQKAQQQTGGVGSSLPNPIASAIPPSNCQNPVFDASDVKGGARAELHICEHVSDVQPLFRWCAYMFTAVGIFGLWFRKLGGT